VLLASYTHSTVDTVLLKRRGADFGVLRLGNVDKDPNVCPFTLADQGAPETIEQLEHR
jgi:DNA replication ATP-dependent helicase Dna2